MSLADADISLVRSTATPLAATMTWILKDGAGMVGRIVFAAYSGTSLDFDCKVTITLITLLINDALIARGGGCSLTS